MLRRLYKRILNRLTELILTHNFKINGVSDIKVLPNNNYSLLKVPSYGFDELSILELLKKRIPHNIIKTTFIDIGANIGNHSIFFSFFNSIISFEPNQFTYGILKLNLSNLDNAKAYNFGLSDQKKKLPYNFNYENLGSGTFNSEKKQDIVTKIETRVFDDEFPNIITGFVKIDVEGFEYRVLKGMKKTLKKHLSIICFEYQSNKNGIESVLFLKDLGYDKFIYPKLKSNKKFNHSFLGRFLFIRFFRFLFRFFKGNDYKLEQFNIKDNIVTELLICQASNSIYKLA